MSERMEVKAELDLTMSDDQNCFRRSPRFSVERDAKLTVCNNSGEKQTNKVKNKRGDNSACVSFLIGDPIPDDEARRRWPYRYQNKR
ncbi:hypothetical protein RDABS01_012990 [Bienertia sinuspersici]